ncbi:MAG: 2-oxo acid dehydrogenase subunit E2 [Planctomycetaceae bacterium]|nr:2-oxo acid dehydrogenase subunit E2 [Planctomycetaceae bacterium]
MELETEKAVIELTCPHEGVVQDLAVQQGDTITVGQVLFTIDVNGRAENPRPAEKAQSPTPSDEHDHEQPTQEKASAEEQPTAKAAPAEPPPAGQEAEFVLPNIGEGVESAEIAEIHVAVGDQIEKDSIVMDLETDKAVVELPCGVAGTVSAVHVSAGDTVKVGQPLLTLSSSAASTSSPQQAPQPSREEKPAAQEQSRPAAADESKREPRPDSPAEPVAQPSKTRVADLITRPADASSPVPAAPSTRRLARQLGVDLHKVDGTGPGGRITQEDVQAFVRRSLHEGLPAVRERGSVPVLAAGSLAPPPLPDFSRFGIVDREKLSKLGRTAAENLSVSWSVIPHVTQHDRADVTDLEAARKRFSQGSGTSGPKVTMTAIVMKALTVCLQRYPKFNSSLDPETSEIVLKRYYHIGCAVDTPAGLLVPVVRDCDKKSILEIAGELGKLAELARDRKLPLDAMQGATCTLTNLGGIGGTAFTPIVNYPEVCILGLARGQKELQLVDGEVRERLMLPLALSYDHRVINGADAARFTVALCDMLADPFQLLSAI